MSRGSIRRSLGADGCFHAFDSERVSGDKSKPNRKIECMKDIDVCRTCRKANCSGTPECVAKRRRELEKEAKKDDG